MEETRTHYELLIDEGNDPFRDPMPLKTYMDRWDGEPFFRALALSGSESVLEIGVGTGRIASRILPHCASFTGIDLSPKTIRRARENLSSLSEKAADCRLICGDFLSYAFAESFDVICSTLTFMHIQNKQEAIGKVSSLLRDGGRFVLSIDKNPSDVLDMGDRKLALYPDSPEQTALLLKQAGLTVSETLETEAAFVFTARKMA